MKSPSFNRPEDTVRAMRKAADALQAAMASEVDPIDELASDPLVDHTPRTAPKHKANRVLSILDQLDRETPNRRFNT